MKYRFFTTSEKAWQAMLEAVESAKRFIFLESFILTDDAVTHGFFEALKKKAGEGVVVKIVVDGAGYLWWGALNKEEFGKAGIEIMLFRRLIHHSHRKVLIVDGETAFVGGVNIRGEYARWQDLHLRITGVLARTLTKSFSRIYELAGGKDPAILRIRKSKRSFRTRHALYRAKCWLIERWPIKSKAVLRHYYLRKCHRAKEKITIVTPYFVPHRWLIGSLKRAAARGVKIEIIVPAKTDVLLADIANRILAKDLGAAFSFYFLPEMNHAKVLLVDGKEGLVGSNNIDAQSFDFNLEASIVFQRKDMVGNLKHILERWKATAMSLEQVNNYNKWYHWFVGFFVRLLWPLL